MRWDEMKKTWINERREHENIKHQCRAFFFLLMPIFSNLSFARTARHHFCFKWNSEFRTKVGLSETRLTFAFMSDHKRRGRSDGKSQRYKQDVLVRTSSTSKTFLLKSRAKTQFISNAGIMHRKHPMTNQIFRIFTKHTHPLPCAHAQTHH